MAGHEAETAVARPDGPARNLIRFAGGLLTFAGLMDLLVAIATAAVDPYFVIDGWNMHHLDVSGWGWLHGTTGVATLIVGLVLFVGGRWAARSAIPVAALSAAVDLLILPYEPYRAALAFGFSVAAIRCCVVYRLRCLQAGLS